MKDIKNKPIKDLMKQISEKKEALLNFRFGSAGSKVKNVKEARNLKKDIARLMTEITAQDLAALSISKASDLSSENKA